MPRRHAPRPRLVDPRNRVALTREVRRALGVGPGDYVTFVIVENEVRLYRMDLIIRPTRTG